MAKFFKKKEGFDCEFLEATTNIGHFFNESKTFLRKNGIKFDPIKDLQQVYQAKVKQFIEDEVDPSIIYQHFNHDNIEQLADAYEEILCSFFHSGFKKLTVNENFHRFSQAAKLALTPIEHIERRALDQKKMNVFLEKFNIAFVTLLANVPESFILQPSQIIFDVLIAFQSSMDRQNAVSPAITSEALPTYHL